MQSFKNVFDLGNNPARYNPVIQAIAWRLSAKSYLENIADSKKDVLFLRYEDIVHSTENSLMKLSEFLKIDIPYVDVQKLGTNSSYRKGNCRILTDTEKWMSDVILHKVKDKLGYSGYCHKPRFADVPEILRVTALSMFFYFKSILRSPDVRARVKNVVKNLLGLDLK